MSVKKPAKNLRAVRRIRQALREAVILSELPRSEIARRSGYSRGVVSKVLNGEDTDLLLGTVDRIANEVGFEIALVPNGKAGFHA